MRDPVRRDPSACILRSNDRSCMISEFTYLSTHSYKEWVGARYEKEGFENAISSSVLDLIDAGGRNAGAISAAIENQSETVREGLDGVSGHLDDIYSGILDINNNVIRL